MQLSDAVPFLASPEGRQSLLATYRNGLLKDTVPFWFPRCVDNEHGGFVHCFDRDGSLIDSDKSVWAQARISWMLLTLFNTIDRNPQWLAWGEHGLRFIERHCFDRDGRMFFHVTQSGKPIRKRRYAYSECFTAIALAAHYKATNKENSSVRAKELFDFFARWNFTPGLMPPKFTDTRPMIGLGPRIMTIVTAQELRANLGDDPFFTDWIDRCIDEVERLFMKPTLRVVMESVAPNGDIVDHFDGRLLNAGHAIEGAWFIMQEGVFRKDSQLIKLGCTMLDWMWERGWDHEYGGLFYFRDLDNKPVQEYWQDMKFWWPHNETIIATLMAYLLSGDSKYARWHQQVHDWSHRHFGDPEHGEWFGYLQRNGQPATTTKGNLWKSFFHHPRMQWMCSQWLNNFVDPM
jgi:N-acylglucosamine 2-epimerase